MEKLDGKVAFVSGAAAGLGRVMAEVLAENGCAVVVTSRNEEKALRAAGEIAAKTGAETLGLALDVTSSESVENAARCARAWKGRIDILINNAGGGSGAAEGHLFDRDYETIDLLIRTNLTGVLFVCKAIGRYMKEQKSGKIINIGSIAGIVGRDRRMYQKANKREQPVDYAAAKGGVIALTRDLAAVMAPYGVNVNCISPGGFDRGELTPAFVSLYSDRTPLGRMGCPEKDLAGTVMYLASDASDYVTGVNLPLDGGFSSWQ